MSTEALELETDGLDTWDLLWVYRSLGSDSSTLHQEYTADTGHGVDEPGPDVGALTPALARAVFVCAPGFLRQPSVGALILGRLLGRGRTEQTDMITEADEELLVKVAGHRDQGSALLERQLVETELPKDLEEWFAEFAGAVDVSLEFDSATYFQGMKGPHGHDD